MYSRAFACGCSKLLNSCVPDSLDERALNLPASATSELGRREALQNNTLCINAAKALGCSLADVTPEDIFEGKARQLSPCHSPSARQVCFVSPQCLRQVWRCVGSFILACDWLLLCVGGGCQELRVADDPTCSSEGQPCTSAHQCLPLPFNTLSSQASKSQCQYSLELAWYSSVKMCPRTGRAVSHESVVCRM